MKSSLPAEIVRAARARKARTVRLLRDVIALPSLSCEEGPVARLLLREMKDRRFDEAWIDGIGNVIGRVGRGRAVIVLDSHIDTVGVGDRAAWKFDPFKGAYRGGVVYGRGASDNKAGMACMVSAAGLVKELEMKGDFTLYVVGSVQEEDCDGLALRYALQNSLPRPDCVVLGECTNLGVYRGHRGRMEMRVRTKGVSCHASAPQRGHNAVYDMAPITAEIEKLDLRLPSAPFLGKGTVAVTKIECTTGSLNTVPDSCTVHLDRRLTAGEDLKTALSELRTLPSVKRTGARVEVLEYGATSHTGMKVGQKKYYPTWVVPEESAEVRGAVRCATAVLGRRPAVGRWIFSTNGVASMGELGIPTIGFGPSKEQFAHSTRDQVDDRHLTAATAFYALFPFCYIEERSGGMNACRTSRMR